MFLWSLTKPDTTYLALKKELIPKYFEDPSAK